MPAKTLDKPEPEVAPPYQPYLVTPAPYTPPLPGGRKRRSIRGILLLWAMVVPAVLIVLYTFVVRPWHLRWGATDREVTAVLPGDELVSNASFQTTRAITINASAGQVWPWLVQLGQGRGGYYSYDWFENLIGCDIHSADSIHAEWQNTRVGNVVRMYPEGGGPPPFTVAAIIPDRALILAQPPLATGDASLAGHTWEYTWAFVLDKVDDHTTRLLVRSRSNYADTGTAIFNGIIEPGVFLMERGMLRGIKGRAEAGS